MADRNLNLTLAGEKYSDGTSLNISYSEERSDPELVEQFSPEGSGATRTFYTAWADRFNFVENMVGFAKISAATVAIPADATWDGRHIHRKLPVGYHMGKTDTSTPPVPQEWVYATRAVSVPDGAKANEIAGSTMSIYEPKATYAKIVVSFAGLDYDLYSDSQVWNGGGSPGIAVGCCREWLRYCRIDQKPASIFFQYPSQALKLVDYPTAGQTKALGFQPSVLDNIADFWVHLFDLPYDPIAAINLCFGMINSTPIFPTPDFSAGQPAESLHLVSADITRLPLRYSRRYWNCQLGFRKVFNQKVDGTYVGHNFVRDTVDEGGVKKLRFFRVSADGTSSVATGNPMIDLVDFRKLFWIPSTCLSTPTLPAGP